LRSRSISPTTTPNAPTPLSEVSVPSAGYKLGDVTEVYEDFS